jgi:hypothetical protein
MMADKTPRFSIQFGQPFAEQVAFFKNKLNLPTERYDDIKKAAHDRAFIVAGAQKADLLNDLHRTIEDKLRDGKGLDEFRRDFKQIVQAHGWHGWTGEGTKKGEAWRTRTIFETNLRTSYAAGREKQLQNPNLLKVAPYLQYIHSGHENYRPQHKQWGDQKLTLRHDHPFWQTHKPPNGWGCACRVMAVVAPAPGAMTTPPGGWDTIDPKTGTPPGIDKGWDYAPGANTDMSYRQMVQDKLITYPPAIAKALSRELDKWIAVGTNPAEFVRLALADRGHKQDLWLGFAPAAISKQAKIDVSSYFFFFSSDNARHIYDEHHADKGKQRPPTPEDYTNASRWLHEGRVTTSEGKGYHGETRLKCVWKNGNEEVHSVWEVRQGKRNRALTLITCYIKKGDR